MLMLFGTGSATSTILVKAGRTWTVRTPTNNYAIIATAEREALGTLHDIA